MAGIVGYVFCHTAKPTVHVLEQPARASQRVHVSIWALLVLVGARQVLPQVPLVLEALRTLRAAESGRLVALHVAVPEQSAPPAEALAAVRARELGRLDGGQGRRPGGDPGGDGGGPPGQRAHLPRGLQQRHVGEPHHRLGVGRLVDGEGVLRWSRVTRVTFAWVSWENIEELTKMVSRGKM